MKKLDYYWASNPDWWHWDEFMNRVINDDAPEEAQKSYRHFLEQSREETE